jgi:uncharacterized protein (DUF433 family)
MSLDLVSTTTAAFIAGLSDRQMQRVVDEDIIGAPLVSREGGRVFAPMTSALARFYFTTSEVFTREARRTVIQIIVKRIERRKDANALFSLRGALNEIDWNVDLPVKVHVEFEPFVRDAKEREQLVERAEASIVELPNVMGGVPVFKGTRVPVSTIVASKRAGFEMDELRASYPFLTPELVQDAETYLQIHPRIGRPPKTEVPTAPRKALSSKRVPLKPRA